jgi:hypothetical protein
MYNSTPGVKKMKLAKEWARIVEFSDSYCRFM